MTDDEQRIPLNRHAARVLPINPAGEVLLLHCINPSAPEAPYWVSVGGGLEPGEDERQAVVRELWEETLIRCDPADLRGPVHREVVEFAWAEYDIVQHQAYYLAEVGDHAVSFARMEGDRDGDDTRLPLVESGRARHHDRVRPAECRHRDPRGIRRPEPLSRRLDH